VGGKGKEGEKRTNADFSSAFPLRSLQMTAFLEWLNPKGYRESKLIDTLKRWWDYLYKGAEKRHLVSFSPRDSSARVFLSLSLTPALFLLLSRLAGRPLPSSQPHRTNHSTHRNLRSEEPSEHELEEQEGRSFASLDGTFLSLSLSLFRRLLFARFPFFFRTSPGLHVSFTMLVFLVVLLDSSILSMPPRTRWDVVFD